MIRNYFLVGFRNLTRNKFFSAINIFGLAVSMSICMAIIMLMADQMMYDQYNANRSRIYRVNTYTVDGSIIYGWSALLITRRSALAWFPSGC